MYDPLQLYLIKVKSLIDPLHLCIQSSPDCYTYDKFGHQNLEMARDGCIWL